MNKIEALRAVANAMDACAHDRSRALDEELRALEAHNSWGAWARFDEAARAWNLAADAWHTLAAEMSSALLEIDKDTDTDTDARNCKCRDN